MVRSPRAGPRAEEQHAFEEGWGSSEFMMRIGCDGKFYTNAVTMAIVVFFHSIDFPS
jgi:hypothetical protein